MFVVAQIVFDFAVVGFMVNALLQFRYMRRGY
jgi:hypothetical protein